jgi:hypothetical protein
VAEQDFSAVAARLREILLPYRDRLVATKDGPGGIALEIAGLEGQPSGYVAGTRVGKSYVSFYLMPVYAWPSLLEGASPELLRRRQGKSCFNFTRVDERLLSELADLTARSIGRYQERGWPADPRQRPATAAEPRSGPATAADTR